MDDQQGKRVDAVATGMLMFVGMLCVVLVSLGLAIKKRSFKGTMGTASFEASGGEEAAPATTLTTTVTQSATVPAPESSE